MVNFRENEFYFELKLFCLLISVITSELIKSKPSSVFLYMYTSSCGWFCFCGSVEAEAKTTTSHSHNLSEVCNDCAVVTWVCSHAPSIPSHRGTKVVWPDFQPMRVPEEPVCIDLFWQKPVITSLHLKYPVLVAPPLSTSCIMLVCVISCWE
jgi:hypothetical protein